MAGSDQWRVAVGDKQRGPLDLDQLRDMIAQGKMPAGALVWRPGMTEWVAWREVPELASAAAAPAAAPAAAFPVMQAQPVYAPPSRGGSMGGSTFGDFLAFRAMITPIFIQILFWIGVALNVISGFWWIIQGISYGVAEAVLLGLGSLILGPLFWRVLCELILVIFRILDNAREINQKMKP